ncbi:MAG: amidohydrolase [Oscillospiraceae bacterium]|nr:amidohydrolase [Oscillospiraceae bacterium]
MPEQNTSLPDNLQIIDMHAHIYPDKIAEKASIGVGEFYNLPMRNQAGSVANLLSSAAQSPIEVTGFLVHSVAVTPKTVESINNFVSSECKAHPQFRGFGTIHAHTENFEQEIERIVQLGLRGIKIHPDTQQFDADCKEMFKIYEILQSKKLPILVHCGDYRYDYSHPHRIKRIMQSFPNLRLIGAHFGGWSVWDLALEYLEDENIYLDCSSSMKWLGKVRTRELIRRYGAGRILFGSDFPMWQHKKEIECLLSLKLTIDELEKIFYKNAKQILDF